MQEPSPAPLEKWAYDADLRRAMKVRGSTAEFYFYEGLDRVATFETVGGVFSLKESTLFDGIDHPLRIKQGATTAYYELDVAGNVRRVRISGGSDVGGYRYTAFGQTKEDTATLVQPLRWQARWHSTLNGTEVYDVRARQWAPEIGAFISIDDYRFHDKKTTLWGWPKQNPVRMRDPFGRGSTLCKVLTTAAFGAGGLVVCTQTPGAAAAVCVVGTLALYAITMNSCEPAPDPEQDSDSSGGPGKGGPGSGDPHDGGPGGGGGMCSGGGS